MFAIQAHKTQALRMEVELNLADRAVAVLGDDQISDVLDFRIVWFVISWAVNKADDVGVLLDGAIQKISISASLHRHCDKKEA